MQHSRHAIQLASLYDALEGEDRGDAYSNLLSQSVERFLPHRDLIEFEPSPPFESVDEDWDNWVGEQWGLALAAANCIDLVLTSPDGDAEAAERAREVVERSLMPLPFDEDAVVGHISLWRDSIIRACLEVSSRMARTVAEAEAQELAIPESLDGWIEYALTIDGERLAEELDDDWEICGLRLVLGDPLEWHSVLDLRMWLYCRLRSAAANDFRLEVEEEHEIELCLKRMKQLVAEAPAKGCCSERTDAGERIEMRRSERIRLMLERGGPGDRDRICCFADETPVLAIPPGHRWGLRGRSTLRSAFFEVGFWLLIWPLERLERSIAAIQLRARGARAAGNESPSESHARRDPGGGS